MRNCHRASVLLHLPRMTSTENQRHLLIISDGKPGHEQQSRALCAGLGCAFTVVRAGYAHRVLKGLSYLFDASGLDCAKIFTLEGPLPSGPFSAVVCAGSTAFYPGRVTARRLGVPVIAVMSPRGYRLGAFDCIVAPGFDALPPRGNVVATPVNLTQTDPGFYARGVAGFEARHHRDPGRNAAGVIIGGNNSFTRMTADSIRGQLEKVFAATEGMQRWVTTSRRTPPEVEDVVRGMPFDYRLLFSEDHFNPIPAFVMLCDTLFVTSDSTGMLSEAVSHGAARVEVLMNFSRAGSKFERFIKALEADGHAHRFDGTLGAARRKVDLAPIFQKVAGKVFAKK